MDDKKQYMCVVGVLQKDGDKRYGKESGKPFFTASVKLVNTLGDYISITVFPDSKDIEASADKLADLLKKGELIRAEGEYKETPKEGRVYKSISVFSDRIKSLEPLF